MTQRDPSDAGTEAGLPDEPTSTSATPAEAFGGQWEDTPYGPLWTSKNAALPVASARPGSAGSAALLLDPGGWTRTPASPSRRIADELAPGERLLWQGRPRPGLILGVGDAIGISLVLLFLLGWTGIVASIAVRGLVAGGPSPRVLIPIGMAAVGLGVIAYIAWLEPRGRRLRSYGVTDRRALIVSGQLRPTVESVPLALARTVTLRLRGDGSGTIEFADFVRNCGEDECSPRFARIDDARRVHELILAAIPVRGR